MLHKGTRAKHTLPSGFTFHRSPHFIDNGSSHHFSRTATHPRSVFDRFRAIAHEGEVDKRVQFTIEELYRVRARGFEAEGFAAVIPSLDLVRRFLPLGVDIHTQGLGHGSGSFLLAELR
jgi:hypothetical protein